MLLIVAANTNNTQLLSTIVKDNFLHWDSETKEGNIFTVCKIH